MSRLTLARAAVLVLPLAACNCEEVGDLAPAGSIEPAVFDFGPITVGTECQANLKVKNTGEVDLAVEQSELADTVGDWSIIKTPSLVKRGAEEDLLLTYVAGSEIGKRESSAIRLTTDDPDNGGVLNGTVTAIVAEAAAPVVKSDCDGTSPCALVSFGPVQINGSGLVKSVNIINDGTADMTVSFVALNDGNAAFTIDSITRGASVITDFPANPITVFAGRDGNNCGAPTGNDNSITVNVRYVPDQIGGDTETLVVLSDSIENAELNIPLVGEGSDTNLLLSPATLNFGALPEGDTDTIEVRVANAGTQNASVNVSCIDLENDGVCEAECESGDAALSGSLTCGVTTTAGDLESKGFVLSPTDGVLDAGDDERKISVTWAPVAGATSIPATAVLALHSNILGDKIFTLPLIGGSIGILELDGASDACGGGVVADVCLEAEGDPADHQTWTGSVVVTLVNTGDATVTISSIELDGNAGIDDDYVITPPADLIVPRDGTVDFTVEYTETDPAQSDQITNIEVNHDGAGAVTTIVLNVVPPT